MATSAIRHASKVFFHLRYFLSINQKRKKKGGDRVKYNGTSASKVTDLIKSNFCKIINAFYSNLFQLIMITHFKTHVYRAYIYDLIFVPTKSQVIFSLSTKGWPSGKSPPRQRT
jgi:hypothetical protein